MSEPMWSSAVIAVLVYGCLPTLGIGAIWSLSVWMSGRWNSAPAVARMKSYYAHAVSDAFRSR